jgi:hypothetical protein
MQDARQEDAVHLRISPRRLRDLLLHPWSYLSLSADRPGISSHARRMQAQEHAILLLKENLSPSQLEQFQRRGYFDVIGGDTGKRYRIWRGSQMNVERLDGKGRCVFRLCFYPEGRLALGDIMLAQKTALELYESEAVMVANKISGELRWPDLIG